MITRKQRIQCLGCSHRHKQEMKYFQSEIHSRAICIDVSQLNRYSSIPQAFLQQNPSESCVVGAKQRVYH